MSDNTIGVHDLDGVDKGTIRFWEQITEGVEQFATLEDVFDRHGIDPLPPIQSPSVQAWRADEPLPDINGKSVEMAEEPAGLDGATLPLNERIGLTQHTRTDPWELTSQDPEPLEFAEEGPDGEAVGVTGTPMLSGKLRMERSATYGPYRLRGIGSDLGLLEEEVRTVPSILDALTSAQEIIANAEIELVTPQEVLRSKQSAVEHICNWHKKWIANLSTSEGLGDQGLQTYFENSTWAALYGFYLHEIVWDEKNGLAVPVAFKPRRANTVWRWVLDDRGDSLAATMHRSYGDSTKVWSLTAKGPRLIDHQLLRCTVAGHANDFEGISLARPSLHWSKVKKLVGKIAPVTADKYGAPRTYVEEDWEGLATALQNFDKAVGEGISEGDRKAFFKDLLSAGFDKSTFMTPRGLKARHDFPGNSMPDFQWLLNYCDQMINLPWSNEGALYGLQEVGSYAMADVADNEQLRLALYIFRRAAAPVNGLIQKMTKRYIGELPEYPRIAIRLGSIEDRSQWLKDFITTVQASPQMNEKARDAAAKKLEVDPETLKPAADQPAPKQGPNAETPKSAQPDPAQMSERLNFAELDPEAAEKSMEDEIAGAANRLRKVAREHRDEFRQMTDSEVQGGLGTAATASTIRQVGDELREKYLPRYEEIIEDEMNNIGREAQRQMLREHGFTVSDDADFAGVVDRDPAMQIQIASMAEEIANRQTGVMRDQRVEQIERETVGVSALAASTLANVASRGAGRALNDGREIVVDEAKKRHQARTGDQPRIKATRSAMMDENTCLACDGLNGEVFIYDSASYWDNHPPNKCESPSGDCRCVYIHAIPDEMAEDMEAVAFTGTR